MSDIHDRIAAMRARDKARSDAIKQAIEDWVAAPGVDFDTFPKYTAADIEGTTAYAFRQMRETWGVILEPMVKRLNSSAIWLADHVIISWTALFIMTIITSAVVTYDYFAQGDESTTAYIFSAACLTVLTIYQVKRWYKARED